MAKPALENVMNDNIQIHPPKFKNMYRSWMENVKDWCISRQLWWGHQIPAYYLPNGQLVVAPSKEQALEKAKKIDSDLTINDLRQDEDVLDTWFSSWLWPISVFNTIGKENTEDLKFYYPTDVLVTGFDIIFFWVARMIMAGYEYMGEMPFKHVYITGMVRDEKGRKMSKSLGNSPDPLDLIAEFGADGVRVGMLLAAPAGNDLLFDKKLCEQGRNFSNKIWNAYRLLEGLEVDNSLEFSNKEAVEWFQNRINSVLTEIEEDFEKFRISEALMSVYKLIWDDFCSWYLEMIKPEYGKPIDAKSLEYSKGFFKDLMKLLHPFMPFITEELWSHVADGEGYLALAQLPEKQLVNQETLSKMAHIQDVVTGIRNVRNTKNILKKDALEIVIKTDNKSKFSDYEQIIKILANISSISYADSAEKSVSFVEKSDEVFVILGDQAVDVEAEIQKIDAEIERLKGFIFGIDKKLSNEKFVAGAPEQVIELERKKKADSEAKIKALEESKLAMA
jgi:valyl-tRNA synthetase